MSIEIVTKCPVTSSYFAKKSWPPQKRKFITIIIGKIILRFNSHRLHTGSGAHPSIYRYSEVFSGDWSEHETGHSLPSSDQLKNE